MCLYRRYGRCLGLAAIPCDEKKKNTWHHIQLFRCIIGLASLSGQLEKAIHQGGMAVLYALD